jgi:hypothetical protein
MNLMERVLYERLKHKNMPETTLDDTAQSARHGSTGTNHQLQSSLVKSRTGGFLSANIAKRKP